MSYIDIYNKRLNRYGLDYFSRLQSQRETNFEKELLKSSGRIDFMYDGQVHPGIMLRYKQDETETLQYLLTRTSLKLPNGTIIEVSNDFDEVKRWMIYYLQEIKGSGYNKYIILKMTHTIKWEDRDGIKREAFVYMYGQEDNMLKDEIRSRSRMDTIYTENLKMSFFVTPLNEHIRRDDYFELSQGNLKEAYRVTGYDVLSTPGVEFVTVDPVYLRDHSSDPIKQKEDKDTDFFWLEGGINGGT